MSFTVCGVPSALSIIIKVPFCGPDAVGVNVTSIEHFAPGASGPSQPLVTLYGPTTPPTPSINTVIPGFFFLPLGLLTATLFCRLSPTVTVPNFNDAGLILSFTGTAVGEALGVAVAVAVRVAVAVAVGVMVAVALGVTVVLAVGLAVTLCVAVAVAVAVGWPVPVGELAGGGIGVGIPEFEMFTNASIPT